MRGKHARARGHEQRDHEQRGHEQRGHCWTHANVSEANGTSESIDLNIKIFLSNL